MSMIHRLIGLISNELCMVAMCCVALKERVRPIHIILCSISSGVYSEASTHSLLFTWRAREPDIFFFCRPIVLIFHTWPNQQNRIKKISHSQISNWLSDIFYTSDRRDHSVFLYEKCCEKYAFESLIYYINNSCWPIFWMIKSPLSKDITIKKIVEKNRWFIESIAVGSKKKRTNLLLSEWEMYDKKKTTTTTTNHRNINWKLNRHSVTVAQFKFIWCWTFIKRFLN